MQQWRVAGSALPEITSVSCTRSTRCCEAEHSGGESEDRSREIERLTDDFPISYDTRPCNHQTAALAFVDTFYDGCFCVTLVPLPHVCAAVPGQACFTCLLRPDRRTH